MKKSRIFTSVISFILVCAFLLNLSGCSANHNLTRDFTPNKIEAISDLEDGTVCVNDFSVNFFKNSYTQGKNTLVSPLSLIYALGMTSNGANGGTLTEIENTLGIKREDLNLFLYSLMQNLSNTEKSKLSLANSIWFTNDERFTVNDKFMQINADYYGADAYKVPFDRSTVNEINNWADDKTYGMIEKIVNENSFSANTIMCLVNAMYFEAEWEDTYYKEDVEDGVFTTANGQKQDCEFMYGDEYQYLANEKSTGFIKDYVDENYAFVALLPNEDVTIDEFVGWLDGKNLSDTLNYKKDNAVYVAIPKFKAEFETKAVKTLNKMGIKTAFDEKTADFSLLGNSTNGGIHISDIIQKNTIEVAEKGTKAASTTSVFMEDSFWSGINSKEIILDRPFVYMIIDKNTNIPLFMGTLNSID